jgi:hypothetical protein
MKALNEMDVPCCAIKDEKAIHEDETIIYVENTKVLEVPAQEETTSFPPPLDFDDALLYDEGNEEEKNELSNDSNPACYDMDNDIVDHIDEFIHVGRRRWDIVGYDLDPIYNIDGPFQRLPLHLSHEITNNFDIWQQEPDFIQTPKDDLILCSPINFRSYLEDFDDYPSEHLDLSYEESYQPTLCLDIDENEEVTSLKQDTCDKIFRPPLITLPRYVAKGVVRKHVPYPESPIKQNLILDFRGKLSASRRILLSQFSNLPFRNGQSSFQVLLIPPRASSCEDVQGSQHSDSSSQPPEPLTFHNPFLRWIKHSPESMRWDHFFPSNRLHELDFVILDDLIHVLTHVIFVLDLSLFWFMMEHKGRYRGTLLDWLHWLFDYTNIQTTGKHK